MRLTQKEFADRIQLAGDEAGDPNSASERLVQRWERGVSTQPRPVYARALQMVTGLPMELLGFPAGVDRVLMEDGRGGHDLAVRGKPLPLDTPRPVSGNYSGIWRSRYEYFSSGRGQALEGVHNVVVLQHGDQLTVRSIVGSSPSAMGMQLELSGSIVTGSWFEQTDQNGYYLGARYHGSIQLLIDPTGRRMAGKWVGFGKSMDINTGPWTLTFETPSTSAATVSRYAGHNG